MLDYLETAAKEKGVRKIKIESTITAKEFYERNGYTALSKAPCSVGNAFLDAYPMEKLLQQEATDAIVNAANSHLAGGGGVDGATHIPQNDQGYGKR